MKIEARRTCFGFSNSSPPSSKFIDNIYGFYIYSILFVRSFGFGLYRFNDAKWAQQTVPCIFLCSFHLEQHKWYVYKYFKAQSRSCKCVTHLIWKWMLCLNLHHNCLIRCFNISCTWFQLKTIWHIANHSFKLKCWPSGPDTLWYPFYGDKAQSNAHAIRICKISFNLYEKVLFRRMWPELIKLSINQPIWS